MAKRKRLTTEKTIRNKIREGRGVGRLADYQPWLRIQDVPSQGLACRSKGWKTQRVHHVLSLLELRHFYVLEWAPRVLDIREQFPLLPLEETIAIATSCGIRHPVHPVTRHPVVLTTDFVITIKASSAEPDLPQTVKYEDDLCSRRVLEKLELERRYWSARGKNLAIVTEEQIPKALAANVEWIHAYRYRENFSDLDDLSFSLTASTVLKGICNHSLPLRDITMQLDDRMGVEVGTSLSITRYLIANRHLHVDMLQPINPSERLNLKKKKPE